MNESGDLAQYLILIPAGSFLLVVLAVAYLGFRFSWSDLAEALGLSGPTSVRQDSIAVLDKHQSHVMTAVGSGHTAQTSPPPSGQDQRESRLRALRRYAALRDGCQPSSHSGPDRDVVGVG